MSRTERQRNFCQRLSMVEGGKLVIVFRHRVSNHVISLKLSDSQLDPGGRGASVFFFAVAAACNISFALLLSDDIEL